MNIGSVRAQQAHDIVRFLHHSEVQRCLAAIAIVHPIRPELRGLVFGVDKSRALAGLLVQLLPCAQQPAHRLKPRLQTLAFAQAVEAEQQAVVENGFAVDALVFRIRPEVLIRQAAPHPRRIAVRHRGEADVHLRVLHLLVGEQRRALLSPCAHFFLHAIAHGTAAVDQVRVCALAAAHAWQLHALMRGGH